MKKIIIDVMIVVAMMFTYWLYGYDFERGIATGILSTIVLLTIIISYSDTPAKAETLTKISEKE